jgi:CBS domain-containing protein
MTTIGERMSRDMLVTEPAVTVGEAAEKMAARNVGSIVVLDGGRLVGILTERDLLRAFARATPRETPVRQCMTPNPETCEATATLEHATVLMLHGGFRHLPIVEGERVVGMLSMRDLVATQVADLAPRGV